MTPALVPSVLVAAGGAAAVATVGVRERDGLRERAGATHVQRARRAWGRLAGRWIFPPLGVAAGLAAGSVVAGLPGALAGVVAALAVPRVRRSRREVRRAVLAEAQLADAVAAISAGLRAGLSLAQAIAYAADEIGPPVGEELRALADRSDLGIPLGGSLERWARSRPGPDGRLVAGVLRLHQRMGGDSPAVLDQMVRTLRERRAAATEVRSLTAQARLSGAILGFLPVGFFLFLSATSRQDIAAAYHSPVGVGAIAAGSALQAAAYLWIRRLLRVEV